MGTEVDLEEIKLLAEKKVAFLSAARKLNEAVEQLNRLYILPDLRKRLDNEQYAAIVSVRETYCKVMACNQELQAGRSK